MLVLMRMRMSFAMTMVMMVTLLMRMLVVVVVMMMMTVFILTLRSYLGRSFSGQPASAFVTHYSISIEANSSSRPARMSPLAC